MDESYEHLCRVCLNIVQDNFESIFIRRSELSPLGLLYKELFDLPIKFGPEHPKYICRNCSQNLRQFNDFKSKAYASYAKFTNIVKDYMSDEPVENVIVFECKVDDETGQEIKIECEELSDVDWPSVEDINSGWDPLSFIMPETPEDGTELLIEEVKEYVDTEYLEEYETKSEEGASNEEISLAEDIEEANSENITVAEDSVLHARRHPCSFCNKNFKTFRDMKNHRRYDHKFTRQKCPLCPKFFVKPSSLTAHLKMHGREASSYITEVELVMKENEALETKKGNIHSIRHKCKTCNETFRTEKEMKAHRRYDHKFARQKCPLCPKGFNKPSLLAVHLKKHGVEASSYITEVELLTKESKGDIQPIQLKCKHCSETFLTVKEMRTHRRYNHKFTKHKCQLCPKVFAKLSSLAVHLRKHGVEPEPYIAEAELKAKENKALDIYPIRYKCTECNETFHTERKMKGHRRVVHRVRKKMCPQCPRKFLKEDLLEVHMKVHHCDVILDAKEELVYTTSEVTADDKNVVGSERLGNDSEEEALIHKCLYCAETFATQIDLHKHSCRENSHELIGRKCPECSKIFVKFESLEHHIRTMHGVATYKCDECHKGFRFKSFYLVHLRGHRKEKDHQCDVCGKQFVTQHELNIHFRSHNNERPYECDICGRRFRMHSHRKNHWLNHFDKKLTCNICGKKFGTPPVLNTHIKRVHKKIRPHKCHICEKYFASKWFIGVHMKKQHAAMGEE